MYIKYENGDAEPPVKIIVALSGLYKVPYDFLIDNKGAGQKSENGYRKVEYIFSEEKTLAVAAPGADYNIEDSYSATVVSMFSKLAFIKQLVICNVTIICYL